MTHQATANGWSLSSHIVSGEARILFTRAPTLALQRVFVTDVRTL